MRDNAVRFSSGLVVFIMTFRLILFTVRDYAPVPGDCKHLVKPRPLLTGSQAAGRKAAPGLSHARSRWQPFSPTFSPRLKIPGIPLGQPYTELWFGPWDFFIPHGSPVVRLQGCC